MGNFREIHNLKKEIKEELRDEVIPEYMQAFDTAHNSWAKMQERIEGKNEVFLKDLKMIVCQQQKEIEKRLDTFDIRLTRVEHAIWSKWILATIFAPIIALFIFSSIILLREITLEKRETKIEKKIDDLIETTKAGYTTKITKIN